MAKKKTATKVAKKTKVTAEVEVPIELSEITDAVTTQNDESNEVTNEVKLAPKPTLATAAVTDLAKKPKAPKAPKIDIIRGRMPLVLVYSIKFLEDGTIGEIASKYRTTVGKVDDIKKEANFGYIKETFKPTTDMVNIATLRCKELSVGEEILAAIHAVGIATPEDEIAFDAIKSALRKKTVKTEKEDVETPVSTDPVDPEVNELKDMQTDAENGAALLKNKKKDNVESAVETLENEDDIMDLLND